MRKWALGALFVAGLLGPVILLTGQEGPKKDVGDTVAKPRKKGEPAEADQTKIPSKLGKKQENNVPEGLPTFKSDISVVDVNIAVLDNKGHFIPNIPQKAFRVLEDNVPQQVSELLAGRSPDDGRLVIEFSNLFQQYWSETWYQTLTAAYGFIDTLKPEDYVAVVAYDMRPEILSDFSTDKRKAYEAMQRLRIAGFSESNLYDALTDTAQRMSDIEGRKAIVLISSGVDTFSKLTFDKTRKILQNAGVPIYAIGLMQALREWYDARGYMGSIQRLDFLQADNQLRTFTRRPAAGLLPAVLRGVPIDLRLRLPGAAQSVFAHLSSQQPGARRQVPQNQSGTGEPCHQ